MSWFEHLFGFEEGLTSVQSNFIVREFDNYTTLTSKSNGRTFNAGRFSVRNISSFDSLLDSPSEIPGRFHIIKCDQNFGSNSNICDVYESQSLPEFDGATFQAASNFNCLEFTHPSESAGLGVTRYVFDRTQGPYCAMAAGAAIVYRNYFIRHSDGTIGQLKKEIELLGQTPIGKYVKHGYPVLGKEELNELANEKWDDLNQFLIGLHENCEVTANDVKGRIVHHVYAAAFDFGVWVAKNEVSLKIAAQLLKAEYRATVLAGWEMSKKYPDRKGAKKLVLTQIGGGVFGNPRKLIVEAVAGAKDLIRASGLDVYLVCYSSRSFKESVKAGLKDLVDELGGRIVGNKYEL